MRPRNGGLPSVASRVPATIYILLGNEGSKPCQRDRLQSKSPVLLKLSPYIDSDLETLFTFSARGAGPTTGVPFRAQPMIERFHGVVQQTR